MNKKDPSRFLEPKRVTQNEIGYRIELEDYFARSIGSNVEKLQTFAKYVPCQDLREFIFGLLDDDLETMQETLNMAKEYNFEYVNFYTTMAYPGSQSYEDALQRGIKLQEKWSGYSQYTQKTHYHYQQDIYQLQKFYVSEMMPLKNIIKIQNILK